MRSNSKKGLIEKFKKFEPISYVFILIAILNMTSCVGSSGIQKKDLQL